MGLYRGNRPLILMKGDFHPYALFKGKKQLAGAVKKEISGEGEIRWQSPYRGKIESVRVQGRGKQEFFQGNNLLPFPYAQKMKQQDGISWEAQEDGRVKVWGKAQTYCTFELTRKNIFETGEKYTIHMEETEKVMLVVSFTDETGRTAYKTAFQGNSSTFLWQPEYVLKQIYLQVNPEKETAPVILFPQINRGDQVLPNEPYCGGQSSPSYFNPRFPLFGEGVKIKTPEGKQISLPPLYGLMDGTGDEYDLIRGKALFRIGKKVFDGTETFQQPTFSTPGYRNFRYICYDGSQEVLPLCSHVPAVRIRYSDLPYGPRLTIFPVGNMFQWIFQVPEEMSSDEQAFQQYLKDQYHRGTPLTVWYLRLKPAEKTFPGENMVQLPGPGKICQTEGKLSLPVRALLYLEMEEKK